MIDHIADIVSGINNKPARLNMTKQQTETTAIHQPAPERPTLEQAAVVVRRHRLEEHYHPEHIARCLNRLMDDIDRPELKTDEQEQAEWDAKHTGDRFE